MDQTMANAERNKRIVLILLIALWFIAGLLKYVAGASAAIQLGSALVTSLLALVWVVYDSENRPYKPSKTLRLFICLLAIIALPIYLLRSRGVRGVFSIVGLVAFFALLVLADALGTLIVQNGVFFASSG
jgi:hypothetical protein